MWLRHLITLLLALVAVLLFWTSQAAWGRVEVGNVRYKFGLLGVARITVPDSGPERNEPCGWYDEAPVALHCRPAAGAASAYLLLRLAPVATALAVVAFVLATFAHLRRGSKGARLGTAPFALASAAGLSTAVLLVTLNVGHALEIYRGHGVEMHGSGLQAAMLAVVLLFVVGALSLYPASMQRVT